MKKNNENDLIREIEELQNENRNLEKRLKEKNEELEYTISFYDSEFQKINFERFVRLNVQFIRNHGLLKYLAKVFQSIWKIFILFLKKIKTSFSWIKQKKELNKILKENKDKKIIIFYPGYDWYMQMYQRPQHMAIHFAERNFLFFYCTINANDNINGFKKIKENLYITNQFNFLKKHLHHYTLYMCANMNGCYLRELKYIEKKNNNILYEYIDDLHEDLTNISPELIERHKYVLSNEKITVVVTAQHLYNKALKYRQNNILLSTNGVVYEDFHITKKLAVPSNIKQIVSQKKPIIGYYGALAKWFDYELILELAKKRPDLNILLIGIDYDHSLAKYDYFKEIKNVFYIGPVNYKTLINYGYYCNVMTIPFIINEITLSTSPVKVFEYMSMEKPIVTTDLPECRKYKSVLIAKNHNDFIGKIDEAIEKQNDKEYKKTLKQEALNNTWSNKVDEIISFCEKNRS